MLLILATAALFFLLWHSHAQIIAPTSLSARIVLHDDVHPLSRTTTAILPINPDSDIDELLSDLVAHEEIHGIILICPDSRTKDIRQMIRHLITQWAHSRHVDISLYSMNPQHSEVSATIQASSTARTDWVLYLDARGLRGFSWQTVNFLLNDAAYSIPFGPRGMLEGAFNVSCIFASRTPNYASYLIPPFIVPAKLPTQFNQTFTSWSDFGFHISRCRMDGFGGIVTSVEDDRNWCYQENYISSGKDPTPQKPVVSIGRFAFVLPSSYALSKLSATLCDFQARHYRLHILIDSTDAPTEHFDCDLPVDTFKSSVAYWIKSFHEPFDILLTVPGLATQIPPDVKYIAIPETDLLYCSWMPYLSLEEWKNWRLPQLDITVITHNRPDSLMRLLTSLSNARFYGDHVNLRIHMEQSADHETMKLVDHFRWKHGSLVVHHRIIHGGLLSAVVESWYPHGNHTYGLLLEDDVELSSFFYVWVKMALLQYRYGQTPTLSLFGISLYQQKNIELRPEGRLPFNPRSLFAANGLADPSSPYLSQIPCSWGAVYFPEHWREFHDYLTIRFSQAVMNIDEDVVPDVRSNKWTRSWKKYFIEMVYLRGYVMLYPNFEGFVALSTNHLEVGSHVKDRSEEKQKMFALPLMEEEQAGMLKVPLPAWDLLPVLNLTGHLVTNLDVLSAIGEERRFNLTMCRTHSGYYDAEALLCVDNDVD